jgi:hypothetical protein
MTPREVIDDFLKHGWQAEGDGAALLRALTAAGFAVVPKEATRDMRVAANRKVAVCTPDGTWSLGVDEAARTWRAMLSAAEASDA